MHDWTGVASDALAAISRRAEGILAVKATGSRFSKAGNNSKHCQMRRSQSGHDAGASNEGWKSMNPAQKAIWYIESHLAEELTLDEIAGVAGISRFHMVRAFA